MNWKFRLFFCAFGALLVLIGVGLLHRGIFAGVTQRGIPSFSPATVVTGIVCMLLSLLPSEKVVERWLDLKKRRKKLF